MLAQDPPLPPATDGAASPLVGRRGEMDVVSAMLGEMEDRGAALVISGPAGIGKSALLAAARVMALEHGLRVLSTAGVEAESGRPFAGLQRLLRPLLATAERLPLSQRSVLVAAMGMDEIESGNRFRVALAALELLSDEAARTPLLVLVDDLHWLDGASREVIMLISRRIESDPIVVLAAVRAGHGVEIADLCLPVLELRGLEADLAGQLLDARAPGLPPATRRRIIAQAAGNPLALRELPAATAVRPSAGIAGEPALMPMTARLERAFTKQWRDLPQRTRLLLLIAAADVMSSLAEVLAAGEVLLSEPLTVSAVQPAMDAGLIDLAGIKLKFRHTLVRLAIYQSADLPMRQRVHAALADVLDGQRERRVGHRAAATFACDDEIAREVEELAGRACDRGAVLEGATALSRAAALTADVHLRARRLLASAELAFEVGRPDMVRALIGDANALALGPDERARAESLSDVFQSGCWFSGLATDLRPEPATVTEAVLVERADARRLAALAAAQPLAGAKAVIDGVASASPHAAADPAVAHYLGLASYAVGDYDSSLRLFGMASDGLGEQGRFGLLARTSVLRSVCAVLVGAWTLAAEAATEADRLCSETEQPIWGAAANLSLSALAGLRGDYPSAESLAEEAQAVANRTNCGGTLAWLRVVRGLTALTAARHHDAFTELVQVFDRESPCHHIREQFAAAGFLADAAVGCGREQEARAILAPLEQLAQLSTAAAVDPGLDYARALLAPDGEAECEFRRALARPWVAVRPFERARLNLAYGIWLRRRRRVMDSREPLRLAARGFEDLHTRPWETRARDELRAAGESSARRGAEAWHQLSPQELQIAHYAAAGASNREIGHLLYLSHRTVASHLYRIFPKLGITARAQLSSVLPRVSSPSEG